MSKRWLGYSTGGLLVLLALGLGHAVLALPEQSAGLEPLVRRHLADSGVDNPVTAVLLNFRAYDTLLEIAVLSLAVIGIWSLGVMPRRPAGEPGLVLTLLVQILSPFMILLAGYFLWAGAHAPGGAFQAGAVLAAALVLVSLSGSPLPGAYSGWQLRLLLMLGLVTFATVGLTMMVFGQCFLEYPPGAAKRLILAIEAASALSIATILAAALRGGRPPGESAP